MSKQRFKTVSTSALTSKKLARLDATDERLFWRIHYASDSYGTMSGDPWDVLQLAVPSVKGYDLDAVEQGIDTLVVVKLLERWQEADEAWWLHVIDHDRHQSGYFRNKRGTRHSPIPPSQRKPGADRTTPEPTGAHRSAPESSAPQAEVSAGCPAGYPLDVERGGGRGGEADAGRGITAHHLAREAAADATAEVEAAPMPPSPRTPAARIRRAQHDLGSLASPVRDTIARRNAASHRMLTEAEELARYWQPACVLLADHGPDRLRDALSAAAAAQATDIKYAATVCSNQLAAAARTASTNPDVGSGDWDHLTAKGA